MSLAPALVRQWLDIDDDEVFDLVQSLFTSANPVQLSEAASDTAKFLAALLRRLTRDYPEVIGDVDELLAEWGVKLAAGEPVR